MTRSHGQADEPIGVNEPAPGFARLRVTQNHRAVLLADEARRTFRKRARVVAVQMHSHFEVETDAGVMTGKPGDWLATNHPDDDPGSDLWPISAERMDATYVDEPEVEPDAP